MAGGWFSGIATGATILFLAQQVKEARKQNEFLVMAEKRRIIRVCSRVDKACDGALGTFRLLHKAIDGNVDGKKLVGTQKVRGILTLFEVISDRLGERWFDDFEEIWIGDASVRTVRRGLSSHISILKTVLKTYEKGAEQGEAALKQFLESIRLDIYMDYLVSASTNARVIGSSVSSGSAF